MTTFSAWQRGAALAALAALVWLPSAASAQTLSLTALPADVLVGQAVELRLDLDFGPDPTLGGGLDLEFDANLLQYTGFVFNPALGDDASFRRLPDATDGRLVGLAFGHFNGLSGPAEVGRFSFTALAPGVAALGLARNLAPAGDFISLQSFGPQAVAFGATQVQVSAVPEPAQAWLLLAGLVALGGRRLGRAVRAGR